MPSEAIRARTEATSAQVVDRGDGNAQVGSELVDVDQWLQAPAIAGNAVFSVDTEQVLPAPTHEPGTTGTAAPLPERGSTRLPARDVVYRSFHRAAAFNNPTAELCFAVLYQNAHR